LKGIMVAITLAIVLGVMIMLLPIVTSTHFTTSMNREGNGSYSGNETDAAPAQNFGEAAQNLGRADIGPALFPSSLLYVGLIIATGLIVASGFFFYFKRKIMM